MSNLFVRNLQDVLKFGKCPFFSWSYWWNTWRLFIRTKQSFQNHSLFLTYKGENVNPAPCWPGSGLHGSGCLPSTCPGPLESQSRQTLETSEPVRPSRPATDANDAVWNIPILTSGCQAGNLKLNGCLHRPACFVNGRYELRPNIQTRRSAYVWRF